MSKLENILGECISQFNQATKLPIDKVNVEEQCRLVIKITEQEIKEFLLDLVHSSKSKKDLIKKVSEL